MNIEQAFEDLPDVLRATVERLKQMEGGAQGEVARRALMHLYRSVQETR